MEEEITLYEKSYDHEIDFLFDCYYSSTRNEHLIKNSKSLMNVIIKEKQLQETLKGMGLSIIKNGETVELPIIVLFSKLSSPKIVLHTFYNDIECHSNNELFNILKDYIDDRNTCTVKITIYKQQAYLTNLEIYDVRLKSMETIRKYKLAKQLGE